jgi:hypothetical protein
MYLYTFRDQYTAEGEQKKNIHNKINREQKIEKFPLKWNQKVLDGLQCAS